MNCKLLNDPVDRRAQFGIGKFTLCLDEILALLVDALLRIGQITQQLVLILSASLFTLLLKRCPSSVNFYELPPVLREIMLVFDKRLLSVQPLKSVAGLRRKQLRSDRILLLEKGCCRRQLLNTCENFLRLCTLLVDLTIN